MLRGAWGGRVAAGMAPVVDAGPDAEFAATDPQALELPNASPATTQGVVSELI
jgi:hypothetical protein